MIRTLWVGLVALVLTLRYGIPIVVASIFDARRLLDRMADPAPRRWARGILRAAACSVKVEGLGHLREEGPQIVVANHQSWFDVFALAAHLPVRYRFVAKKELRRIPIFGPAWQAAGHVSIDRDDLSSAIEALEEAADGIQKEAVTVVMFPEGTRSPTGELLSFKKGAFVLAIQARVPVVPIAVLGTHEIMPKGSWRITPGEITLRIGEPLPTAELVHRDREELRNRAWRAVAALKGEIGEVGGGRPPPDPRPGRPGSTPGRQNREPDGGIPECPPS